ncbi:TM1812 family CRISPR-associated protein [Megasphaera elsdenii]|uniref:TM1812 family CRISPR-associated protein n=1 Tax=Megasphaera elsdenii TaxID=907 RepID=UPI002670A512|nr:TM1812 family CRISPR-associated protein [Megasphaera elsdenii]
MITFLSDVKYDSKAKDIRETRFNMLLGTNPGSQLSQAEQEAIKTCRTTNETAVKYEFYHEHREIERIFAFVTKTVKEKIYENPNAEEKKEYEDKQGNQWTHLDYFKNRIEIFFKNLLIVTSDFEENSDDTDKVITNIIQMTQEIWKYMNSLPGNDKVIMHIDFTGGPRHTAAIIMAIARLLQYDKRVDIGDVLYAEVSVRHPEKNCVHNIKDIYHLFDFVAGAEEFSRFGSALTLNAYYRDFNPYDQDDKQAAGGPLLEAISAFAEAIKLCHYEKFQQAINQLRAAMKEFHQNRDMSKSGDALMNCLYERIEADYDDLLQSGGVNDLTLIRWCLKHDYLQQALTLYTERVPEYLYEHKVCSLSDKGRQKWDNKYEDGRPGYNLFAIFDGDEKKFEEINDIFSGAYGDIIRQDLAKKNMSWWKNDSNKAFEDIKTKVENLTDDDGIKNDEIKGAICKLLECNENYINRVFPYVAVYIQDENRLKNTLEVYRMLWSEDEFNRIPKKYEIISGKIKKILFGDENYQLKDSNEFREKAKNTTLSEKDLDSLFPTVGISRTLRMVVNFCGGFVECDENIQSNILRILKDYFEIRDERNHTNHALRREKEYNSDTIKKMISQSLDDVEHFCNKVHPL